MTKWEYCVMTTDLIIGQHYKLNEFGKDGWELVSVDRSSKDITTFYFKREIIN